MILDKNLPEVLSRALASTSVLDVGGWFQPLNAATHVLDIEPYETRRQDNMIDPQNPERFARDTWQRQDACVTPWPYPDGAFDFSFCSHTLEDIRDPIGVCRELFRVARAGYIEIPSRVREIYSKQRFAGLSRLAGRAPRIGDPHHRWMCEHIDGELQFFAKTPQVLENPRFYITRAETGRKLTADESGIGIFWEAPFPVSERWAFDVDALAVFKKQALHSIRAGS